MASTFPNKDEIEARLAFLRDQNQRTIDRLKHSLDRLRVKHGIPDGRKKEPDAHLRT